MYIFVGILFSTLWVYLFFSSNATNRHFWLSSLESRGNLFFWIVLVACESSFNLCKFNFESQREGFSLSKIFTETKLEITRHMKGYWHFQGYTFKAHWHFLQNFYFAHKTIKKTCNYILKIYATRTDIGIFEGTTGGGHILELLGPETVWAGTFWGVLKVLLRASTKLLQTCCISLFYFL